MATTLFIENPNGRIEIDDADFIPNVGDLIDNGDGNTCFLVEERRFSYLQKDDYAVVLLGRIVDCRKFA